MIGRVLAIALNTFREARRSKVLYSLLLFALAMIATARMLGEISLGEQERTARDVGLAGISLFGVLVAVYLGVSLLYKEVERKTVFAIIPKPIRRPEFVVGKFFGMVITLAVQVAIMAGVLLVVLATLGGDVGGAIIRAVVLLFAEVVVVAAIAVFFSSWTSPFLSGAFTLGMFVLGRSVPDLIAVTHKLKAGALSDGLRAMTRVLPDFHLFYVSGSFLDGKYISVHGEYVTWSYVAQVSGYGLFYAALALLFASLLFNRRDFI